MKCLFLHKKLSQSQYLLIQKYKYLICYNLNIGPKNKFPINSATNYPRRELAKLFEIYIYVKSCFLLTSYFKGMGEHIAMILIFY